MKNYSNNDFNLHCMMNRVSWNAFYEIGNRYIIPHLQINVTQEVLILMFSRKLSLKSKILSRPSSYIVMLKSCRHNVTSFIRFDGKASC